MQLSQWARVNQRRKLALCLFLVVLSACFAPSVSGGAQAETDVSPEATPEVQQVKPGQAAAGEEVTVTIDGRNFSRGAYVSFTSPAVRVLSTCRVSATQLETKLAIGNKAGAGTINLYVSNPASAAVQKPFTIVAASSPPAPAPPAPVAPAPAPAPDQPSPAPTPTPAPNPTPATTETPTTVPPAGESKQFQVYNLGDSETLLQSYNKPKGTLTIAGGKISYQEAGKQIFSLAPGEIKEIGANTILGVNTGTFHVILNSGKTYNFVAASLSPSDSQPMVDSLLKALH